jgi:hypothetical protein
VVRRRRERVNSATPAIADRRWPHPHGRRRRRRLKRRLAACRYGRRMSRQVRILVMVAISAFFIAEGLRRLRLVGLDAQSTEVQAAGGRCVHS